MMEKALDISKYQSRLNVQTAKSAGIATIICRCAYAASKDVKWDEFSVQVKSSGLRLGCYGFLTAHYNVKCNGSIQRALEVGRQQVDYWISLAKAAGIDSWFAIDQELEAGYSMALSKADNTTLLIDLCERAEAAGLHPCVYCSAGWASARIDLARFKYPLWIAWYYNDPQDPDFDGCKTIEELPGTWGNYVRNLGDQLCMWQFGRIGYGLKYGVGSANVDKDWLVYHPEKEERPVYNSDILQIGPASAGDLKTLIALAESLAITVKQYGDMLVIGPMSAGDRSTISDKALSLGLPCVDYVPEDEPGEPEQPDKEPEDPQQPGVDLAEVMAALKRIEETQAQHGKKLDSLTATDELLLKKLDAAGAALAGDYSDDT